MNVPAERLEKRLARVARELGLDQERLRRWVSFLALCGVLQRAVEHGLLNGYFLKGGVALELRFAGRARATKDLDLALDAPRGARLELLQRALAVGFDDFSFRAKRGSRELAEADAVRVDVAVAYRTRSWQTVQVDLGAAQPCEVDLVAPEVRGVAGLGLPVTPHVPCLGLSEQVAQKLHACTGPQAAGRARDVLDILLIEKIAELNIARTAEATKRLFDERGTHAFPPRFTMPL